MGLIRYTFYSSVLREQVNTIVLLPSFEGWRDQEGSRAYYGNYGKKRTLYVLHGGSDDCAMYIRHTRLEDYAIDYNLAVVLPEVRNSFYCNMKHGKNYFTFISEELPRVMEAVFPLSSDPKDRFVLGNSMGSHGAVKWALNCPDFFAAVCGMSGAGDLEELGFYSRNLDRVENAFGTLEQYRGSMNDFKHLVKTYAAEHRALPRMCFCCGRQDGFYDGAKKFAEYMKEMGFEASFEDSDGAHNWEFWDRYLPIMIQHLLGEA